MASARQQKILDTFRNAGRPLSPSEVHSEVIKAIPRLGIATVYRAIKQMLEEGVIERVDIPGETMRYEPSEACNCEGKCTHRQPAPAGHAHFVCRSCHKAWCLPQSQPLPKAERGFLVESVSTTLHGLCPQCQSAT